jgi:hypothetical protein
MIDEVRKEFLPTPIIPRRSINDLNAPDSQQLAVNPPSFNATRKLLSNHMHGLGCRLRFVSLHWQEMKRKICMRNARNEFIAPG